MGKSKQLDADIKAAICWHVDIALELSKRAFVLEGHATTLIDQVRVVTACAELPGDMPLRVRLMPHVFTLKA